MNGLVAIEDMNEDDDVVHYGVKGMRWGVRRNLQKMDPSDRAAYLQAKDSKWLDKVEKNPKLSKVSKIAAKDAKQQTKALKKYYKEQGVNLKKDRLAKTRYDSEVKAILENSLDKASYKVHGMSPTRLREVQLDRLPDGTIMAKVGLRTNAKITQQQGKIAKADAKREKKAAQEARKEEKRLQKEESLSHALDISEEDFDGLEFFITTDDEGFVEGIVTPFDTELAHDDLEDGDVFEDTEEFLAHYGVKGMKWGVRRSRELLGRLRGGKKSDPSSDDTQQLTDKGINKAVKKLKKGEVIVIDTDDGPKILMKTSDGGLKETRLSADAERAVKTANKEFSEMSDREMRETINRAKLIDEYNKIFTPVNPESAAMRERVEQMKLQKEYAKLQAEMNPGIAAQVASFAASMTPAYKAFKTADDLLGNELSNSFKKAAKDVFDAANQAKQPKQTQPDSPKPPKPSKKKYQGKPPGYVPNPNYKPDSSPSNTGTPVFNIRSEED